MKEDILNLFEIYGSLTLKELEKKLKIKSSRQMKELIVNLNELEDERLIYNNHSKYHLIDNVLWMAGKAKDISQNEYLVSNRERRVYVPKYDSRILFDTDEVLVKLKKNGNEVVHVYERGIKYITGTFIWTRRGWKFRSDVDLHTSFLVENLKDFNLSNNMKAVVKVVDYTSPLKVKIVKLLGYEDEPGVDISGLLSENNVRQEFDKKVEKELKNIPDKVHKKDLKGRMDLRNLTTITIDGDHTKDFDDAISISRLEDGGYRLWVHIADVSHYVQEGKAIDEEAYKRGTSIYVTDRVVPMLPFKLSNGICSLNPEVDRLTISCRIDFDKDGNVIDSDLYESVINSNYRTTYKKVNEFLDNPESVPEYKPIEQLLTNFSSLASILKKNTKERGHIDFETKEPYFVLDEKGKPTDIQIQERGWAEQMIEEAMVAANVAVAHALNSRSLPGIYRVHESPDETKVQLLIDMAKAMGLEVPFSAKNVQPKDIADFLGSIENPDVRSLLSTVAVRSMAKAQYLDQNKGHYGLALEEYCHFTSPIRRYPDLLIHRMIRRHILDEQNDRKTIAKDARKMKNSALHLSEKERDAVMLERAVNDLKSAQYMEDKVGQEFDGIVSGVTNFGYFVELDNTVEGLIPLRTLSDDFYKFDADLMMLKGENTGREIHLGQPVRVRVADVNVAKRQMTFAEIQETEVPENEEAQAAEAPEVIETEVLEIPESFEETTEEIVPAVSEEAQAADEGTLHE